MASFLKSMVSQDLRRLKDDQYDLDMTYVEPNLIAMGFPASGVEGYFRNHISDISRYLAEKHRDHFLVFNLSERTYDSEQLANRVITMGFPDHHAPPLMLLFRIMLALNSWLKGDPANVAVVHCVAGRGRTGTIITAYLIFSGTFAKIEDALTYYARQRSATSQGVTQPSQRRYTFYLDDILRLGIRPKPKRLLLQRVRFGPVPAISTQGGLRPVLYLYNYSKVVEEFLFVSENQKDKAAYFMPGTRQVTFDFAHAKKPIYLAGDITLKIFHVRTWLMSTQYDEIVRLIFHTGFECLREVTTTETPKSQRTILFAKNELDNAYKDHRISDDFKIELDYVLAEDQTIHPDLWSDQVFDELVATHEINKRTITPRTLDVLPPPASPPASPSTSPSSSTSTTATPTISTSSQPQVHSESEQQPSMQNALESPPINHEDPYDQESLSFSVASPLWGSMTSDWTAVVPKASSPNNSVVEHPTPSPTSSTASVSTVSPTAQPSVATSPVQALSELQPTPEAPHTPSVDVAQSPSISTTIAPTPSSGTPPNPTVAVSPSPPTSTM